MELVNNRVIDTFKISKAFTNEKYISIAVSSVNFHRNLIDIWKPFFDRNISGHKITGLYISFSLVEADVLFLTLRTNQYHFIQTIKGEIDDISKVIKNSDGAIAIDRPGIGWYSDSDSLVFINDFYLSSISFKLGYNALKHYELLLQESTNAYLEFLVQSYDIPDVIEENKLERILPIQVILIFNVLNNKEEVIKYYRHCYDRIMVLFGGIDKKDLDTFISLVDNNYEEHKEMFTSYIGMLLVMISSGSEESDWISKWDLTCKSIAKEIHLSEGRKEFSVYDQGDLPAKWVFLDTVLYSIHNQYHFDLDSELNLYYATFNSLMEIKNDE